MLSEHKIGKKFSFDETVANKNSCGRHDRHYCRLITWSDLRATDQLVRSARHLYQLVRSARHLVFQMKCRGRRGDIISLYYTALQHFVGGRKFTGCSKIKGKNFFRCFCNRQEYILAYLQCGMFR